MATVSFAHLNQQLESISEFLQRFKVQCSDLLEAADDNAHKKSTILVKALNVSVITELQKKSKPTLLTEATYDDLEAQLLSSYGIKKSIIGASVKFLNMKQGSSEFIEDYVRVVNDLASECDYKNCCLDRLRRDVFVSGLQSSTIFNALLQDYHYAIFFTCGL